MRDRWLHVRGVAAVLVVIVVLAPLDFVLPRGGWYSTHPMTSAAVTTVVGFLVAGLFVDGWLKDREGRRLESISKVAYRSLAQFVNDAGRSLLAPLNGADLHALAIPGAEPDDVHRARERLARHGHPARFTESTGSWRIGRAELDPLLDELLADPGYVRAMFRVTAQVRRRLQEATALWAPVMLTSTSCANDLGRLARLTDALELLQEHWRLSGLIGAEPEPWTPQPAWRTAVRGAFWDAIDSYVGLRDEFAVLARLPSDRIVRRRGGGPDSPWVVGRAASRPAGQS